MFAISPVLRLCILFVAGLIAVTSLAAHSQVFTTVDVNGAGTGQLQGTIVKGIDAAGDVAGTYIDSKGAYHGFVRAANGTVNTFEVTGAGTGSGQGNVVTAMDSAGDLTGYTTNGFQYQYEDDFFTVTPNGTVNPDIHLGDALSINTAGTVTGFQYYNGGGFLYSNSGGFNYIGIPVQGETYDYITVNTAINSSGVITGYYLGNNLVSHGFVRAANGTITTFDPTNVATAPSTHIASDSGTIPTSIDTAGDIAGTYTDTTGSRHSFVRTAGGTLTPFDPTGTDTTCASTSMGALLCGSGALGMDDAMDVVGTYFDDDGVAHGYIRTASGSISTYDDPNAGTGTFEGTAGFAINATGTIAGTYVDSNSIMHGFLYTPPAPSFTISGATVSVTPGQVTNNTSTITITPANGFIGSVALSAVIATSPAGAVNLPTLSFGSTTPVNITGASNGTATLTISTTAPISGGCSNAKRASRGVPWSAGGGAFLACVLLFGLPARRRKWRTMLGMIALLAALSGGLLACGGSSGTHVCPAVPISGTTPGAYTITVTGTAGAITTTGTVNLTVE